MYTNIKEMAERDDRVTKAYKYVAFVDYIYLSLFICPLNFALPPPKTKRNEGNCSTLGVHLLYKWNFQKNCSEYSVTPCSHE